MKTEKKCRCGKVFIPHIKRNGFLVSKSCPDCFFNEELSKRIARRNKAVKTAKNSKIDISKIPSSVFAIKEPRRMASSEYDKKTTTQLLEDARRHFNKFIRNRDANEDGTFFCPTCGKIKRIYSDNYQACHVFPAGLYPALRFDERNVYGGCKQCNYFKHGVGYEYVEWCRKKLGEEEFQRLIDIKDYWKGRSFKWDRLALIEIIEHYKKLNSKHDKKDKT